METGEKAETRTKGAFFYGWWILLTGTLCYIYALSTMYATTIFFPSIQKELGWTRADLAYVFSAFSWMMGLWGPLSGWICDRIGNRKTILLGLIIVAAGLLLLATADQIWQVFVYYSLLSAFGAVTAGPIGVQSLIRKWFMRKAGTANGILNAIWGATAALLFPLLGAIAVVSGWRLTLAVSTIAFAGFSILFTFIVIRDTPESKGLNVDGVSNDELAKIRASMASRGAGFAEQSMTRNEAMKTPQFWLTAVASGLQSTAATGIGGQITMIALSVGMPAAQAGTAMTAFMIPSIFGRFAGGWLGDRFGKRRIIIISALISAVIMFCGYLFTRDIVTMYVFLFFAGLIMMMAQVLYSPTWGDMYGRRNLAGIIGSAAVVVGLILGIGPLLSGLISQATGSYNVFFLILAVFYVLQAILMLLKRPTRIELGNKGS